MEVQDGYILGIFNYCDRWCERCALTSRCRLFADQAEREASRDPNLKAVADAPPHASDATPPPSWMRELIAEMNEACLEAPSSGTYERFGPCVPPAHASIEARALDYATRTSRWLRATGPAASTDRDARDTIAWFHFLIAAKTNRALTEWPGEDDGEAFARSDRDGSAKVALLGIERSHGAWLELAERGAVPRGEADAFIGDLVWLGEALERVRPHARSFVRPGFDEPEAVARLPP